MQCGQRRDHQLDKVGLFPEEETEAGSSKMGRCAHMGRVFPSLSVWRTSPHPSRPSWASSSLRLFASLILEVGNYV